MKKHEAILKEAKERMKTAVAGWSTNIEKARDDVRFLNHEQWPDSVKKERELDGRPCLTFDHLNQNVRQIVGDERQNKPAIKIRSRGADTESIPSLTMKKAYKRSEVMDGIVKSIEDNSKAATAYDTAFEQAVRGGFGYIRIITEFTDDDSFDQDIKIKRVRNPFSVYFDPGAQEPDGSDGNYCFVVDRLTKDEFDRQYKGKGEGDLERNAGDQWWFDGEYVRVAEYIRRTPVKKTILLLSDGRVVYEEDIEPILDELATNGVTVSKTREVEAFKVEWFKITGSDVLEGPTEIPGKYITIVPVLGEELVVDGEPVYRSAIRGAKDSQMSYNYSRTAHIETSSLAPKVPYIVGSSQINEATQAIWSTANTKNHAYLPYDDSKNPNPPQRNIGAQVQSGHIQDSMQAVDDIKAATGIYDSSLGARSNETSGRAILARQREGDVGTFVFTDNLSKSIQHVGQILCEMIPKIYDSERVAKIMFQDGSEDFVQLNQTIMDNQTNKPVVINDLSAGKYESTVTVGPSYTTKRMEAAESMIQFVQALPQAGQVMGDLIAQNMDWPGADEMAKRLKMLLPPGLLEDEDAEPKPPPPPTPAEEAEMMKQQAVAETAKATMATAEAKIAEAQAKMVEIQERMTNMESNLEGIVVQGIQEALSGLLGPPQTLTPEQQGPVDPGFLLPEGNTEI